MLNSQSNSSRYLRFALAGLLAIWVSAPSWAGIYKCTDGAGRKTYSDKPCEGQIEIVDPMKVGINTVAAPKPSVATGTASVASPRPIANVATSPMPPGSYRLTDVEEQRLRELKNPKALSSLQETKTLIPSLAGR